MPVPWTPIFAGVEAFAAVAIVAVYLQIRTIEKRRTQSDFRVTRAWVNPQHADTALFIDLNNRGLHDSAIARIELDLPSRPEPIRLDRSHWNWQVSLPTGSDPSAPVPSGGFRRLRFHTHHEEMPQSEEFPGTVRIIPAVGPVDEARVEWSPEGAPETPDRYW